MSRRFAIHFAALAALCSCFPVAARYLRAMPRIDVSVEMQVALPRSLQVALAGGDRYLAANIATFRGLVVSTENMRREDYPVLGKVQSDASWLNPAHEDNYYIAAAILPWNGEVASAQEILARAVEARPFDYHPAFYYAFNLLHFGKDPLGAARALRQAAKNSSHLQNQLLLESMAARWVGQSDDLTASIDVLRSMIENARYKGLRDYLALRLQRIERLQALRLIADSYEKQHGSRARSLGVFLADGLLMEIPIDPFGQEYVINDAGTPVLADKKQR